MWIQYQYMCILKSQSSLSFKPNVWGGSKEWADSLAEGCLLGYQVWFCICLVTIYTTSYSHKYILWVIKTAKLITNQLSEYLYN